MSKEKCLCMLLGRWLYYFLIASQLFIVASCATLPLGEPVSEEEQLAIAQDFQALVDSQQGCMGQIDADISVRFEKLLQHGRINGYLLAMPPAYLRFDGINPLGLTEVIFSTDGHQFTLVTVRKQMAYTGPVTAEKIQQYIPQGFTEDFVYLLNGLLPNAEEIRVWRVRKQEKGSDFWLDLDYPDSSKTIKVLYRSDTHAIDRIIITPPESKDSVIVSYRYDDNSLKKSCPEPQSIGVDRDGSGVVIIDFSKRYPVPSLTKERFQVVVPPNYKQVTVL